jgi:hypothetical protein
MCKHESSYCPRCGSLMTCKVGNITQCDCFSVIISEATRVYLAQTDYGCVCNTCLQELDMLVTEVTRYPFPTRKGEFIEGVHFYVDRDRWVFTEAYHIARGYCCGNQCRHCPYRIRVLSE